MQLHLDYGRSGWDDYEFDIDKGKTGVGRVPCTGYDEASRVQG